MCVVHVVNEGNFHPLQENKTQKHAVSSNPASGIPAEQSKAREQDSQPKSRVETAGLVLLLNFASGLLSLGPCGGARNPKAANSVGSGFCGQAQDGRAVPDECSRPRQCEIGAQD